jgi:hypothetical protein
MCNKGLTMFRHLANSERWSRAPISFSYISSGIAAFNRRVGILAEPRES